MPREAADGEIAYWVNLIIQSDQGSPDQQPDCGPIRLEEGNQFTEHFEEGK